ncbi:hypothetical protein DM558_07525 [Entomomonas moraniae]|uniref:Phage tail protein n=1 Tax=Entomomonas moraniae TaxID=2213226 RepID=A0A3S9XDV7_9GAMM|nr:hypothetical protein [Entomomonas moraniae]AZS50637.1 hypothetical protein DM558_07525 [Entomomonas moraniae]
MSYYTATASTANALLTALQTGCTENGWTVSGSLIYKNNCVMDVSISGNGLRVIGGTGLANGALTGQILLNGKNTLAASLAGVAQSISYPLTYHLHVFDKEVYLFVNYNVDNWSYIAFGQSPVAGITGTGNWYGGIGTGGDNFSDIRNINNQGQNGHHFSLLFSSMTPSGIISNQGQQVRSFIHHGLDGNEWSVSGEGVGSMTASTWATLPSQASATLVTAPLLNRQPNSYNGEAILLPITPAVYHKDNSTLVIVGNLKQARYIRIDNYEPGQIIILGDTKYKVYPWLKKNTAARDGESYNGSNYDTLRHSGTFGIAVLYEGE